MKMQLFGHVNLFITLKMILKQGNFEIDEVRDMLGYGVGNPDKQYAMGGRVNYNQGTPKQEIVANHLDQ